MLNNARCLRYRWLLEEETWILPVVVVIMIIPAVMLVLLLLLLLWLLFLLLIRTEWIIFLILFSTHWCSLLSGLSHKVRLPVIFFILTKRAIHGCCFLDVAWIGSPMKAALIIVTTTFWALINTSDPFGACLEAFLPLRRVLLLLLWCCDMLICHHKGVTRRRWFSSCLVVMPFRLLLWYFFLNNLAVVVALRLAFSPILVLIFYPLIPLNSSSSSSTPFGIFSILRH